MRFQIFLAAIGLIGLSLLAEGGGAAKGSAKKPVHKPGHSSFTPSQKPLKPLPVTKVNIEKDKHVALVKKSSPSWNTTTDQKAALDKLVGNQPLTDQDRQQLSDLLFNAQEAGLSKEDETALSYLLLDEAARADAATPDKTPSQEKTGPLFLRIYNNTGERLKVYVKVLPEAAEKKDKEEPAKKIEPLVYDLATGKAYDLQQKDGKRVQASAVNVWALTPTRSWAHHRDDPLYLTTPTNKSKTYLLTFSDK